MTLYMSATGYRAKGQEPTKKNKNQTVSLPQPVGLLMTWENLFGCA